MDQCFQSIRILEINGRYFQAKRRSIVPNLPLSQPDDTGKDHEKPGIPVNPCVSETEPMQTLAAMTCSKVAVSVVAFYSKNCVAYHLNAY